MKRILLLCWIFILVTPVHAQDASPYRIAFWINDDLYTIDADGQNLTEFPFDNVQFQRIESAAWSPDGEQVLLVMANVDDAFARLVLADSDGSNPRILLDDRVYVDAAPLWSSDGTRISFRHVLDGEATLMVMDADGSHLRPTVPVTGDMPRPALSPDGKQLAYLTGFIDNLNIMLLDLTTGESREVVHEMTDGNFKWSPDARYIAFRQWNASHDIYTVNIKTGGDPVQLFKDENGRFSEELFFTWSPDGSQIAVTSVRYSMQQIYTMNPDGDNVRQITDDDNSTSLYAYSPDGKWIAYGSSISYLGEVWIMHPDGSGARQLTFDEEGQGFVAWSPDSAEIMLYRYGEDQPLSIVNISSGEECTLPTPPGAVRLPHWIGAHSP